MVAIEIDEQLALTAAACVCTIAYLVVGVKFAKWRFAKRLECRNGLRTEEDYSPVVKFSVLVWVTHWPLFALARLLLTATHVLVIDRVIPRREDGKTEALEIEITAGVGYATVGISLAWLASRAVIWTLN